MRKKACVVRGCLTYTEGKYCEKHKPKRNENRPNAQDRGYGRKWQIARAGYLKNHPYCVECEKLGEKEPATVVDHIVSHKGDMKLFWDKTNWQALCKRHHDRKTAIEDSKWKKNQ